MNAERLAEIRSMMDMPHFDGVQAWVVRELLDHIAQLEAQRGGALPDFAPDAAVIQDAVKLGIGIGANKPERGGSAVVSDVRSALEGLLDALDADWTDWGAHERHRHMDALKAFGREALTKSGSIPASQVLQPGMVGVDREELEVVNEFVTLQRKIDGGGDVDEEVAWHHGIIKAEKKIDRIRAIRSQAGEVNHAI